MKSFQNAILHLRGDTQKKEKFVRNVREVCVLRFWQNFQQAFLRFIQERINRGPM